MTSVMKDALVGNVELQFKTSTVRTCTYSTYAYLSSFIDRNQPWA